MKAGGDVNVLAELDVGLFGRFGNLVLKALLIAVCYGVEGALTLDRNCAETPHLIIVEIEKSISMYLHQPVFSFGYLHKNGN